MRISVVIPVYNGSNYIRQCITSVIEQDEEVEILLIDDCSTDHLDMVVQCLRKEGILTQENFRYIMNNVNCGVAESRNRGIMEASGDYIAFLDADDWWEPGKLKEQIKLIEEKNAIFVYTSRKNIFTSDGRTKILNVAEEITYDELLKGNQITCSSVLLRADIAKEYLMINDDIHEDYYMWLRILKDHDKAYGINKPFVNYRVHDNSKSNNKIKSAIMTFKTQRLMKEPFIKTCIGFVSYMIAGVKKYK